MSAKCLILAALVAAAGAAADVEELFSRYLRVFRPRGEFAARLIRAVPPAGDDWRLVDGERHGFRIRLPRTAAVNAEPSGSRVLQVILEGAVQRPRPVLRVDSFRPGKDDPTDVDAEYVAEYAEQYPIQAFNNRFTVSESGLVVLGDRLRLAMVGGTYLQGAAPAFRVQWVHLSRERQLFFTFDCAEGEVARYADQLARILLSLEIPAAGKK